MMSPSIQVTYLLLLGFPAAQALHAFQPQIPPGGVPKENHALASMSGEPVWPKQPRGTPLFHIIPKSSDMCIEGAQDYMQAALHALVTSNMDMGWMESKVEKGPCKLKGYNIKPQKLLSGCKDVACFQAGGVGGWIREERCFPDAKVWLDGVHMGFEKMDQNLVDEHNAPGAGRRDSGGNKLNPNINCLHHVDGDGTERWLGTLDDQGKYIEPLDAQLPWVNPNTKFECKVADWLDWTGCEDNYGPEGKLIKDRRHYREITQEEVNEGGRCPKLEDWDPHGPDFCAE